MSRHSSTPQAGLSAAEVTALIDQSFPQINAGGRSMHIETVGRCNARVRLAFSDRLLRPGGTISGPAMFTLADFSIYVALIATLGTEAVPAVTTNLNITFLHRPEPRDLIADTRIVRLGRKLAYAEVSLRSDGIDDVVAHATGSYAMLRRAQVE